MFRTWTHAIDLLECFDFVDNFDLGDCLDSVLGVFGDLCGKFECSMWAEGVVGVRPARLSIAADGAPCFDRCCFGGGSKSL